MAFIPASTYKLKFDFRCPKNNQLVKQEVSKDPESGIYCTIYHNIEVQITCNSCGEIHNVMLEEA